MSSSITADVPDGMGAHAPAQVAQYGRQSASSKTKVGNLLGTWVLYIISLACDCDCEFSCFVMHGAANRTSPQVPCHVVCGYFVIVYAGG